MRPLALVTIAFLSACGGRVIVVEEPPEAGASDGAVEGGDSLPSCHDNNDCFGAQSCQQGRCCAGVMQGGLCRCGDGPGCDVRMTCCMNRANPKWTCVLGCVLDSPGGAPGK